MKSQIRVELRKDYLLFRITGTYDFNEFLALADLIKARCEKEQIYKVLLNCLELKASDLSTADRYFLGEKMALELRGRVVIAVVWPAEHIDKFAETVAHNRGGMMFVTGDVQSAEAWLEKTQI